MPHESHLPAAVDLSSSHVPRCPRCSASMTVSCGAARVARCEACGGAWLDAVTCMKVFTVGLDDAARELMTSPVAPRRALRSPFREAGEGGAAVRACPVCLGELRARYVHDADVMIHVCEHGALIEHEAVAPFLLASDIRRTLAECDPPGPSAQQIRMQHRPHLPGGLLLRIGAVLFGLSLVAPATHVAILWSKSLVLGFVALAVSPLVAVAHPALVIPVLANFIALAILLFSRRMGHGWMTFSAFVFAAAVVLVTLFGLSGAEDVLVGYWMWCAALALFAVGTAKRAMHAAR